MFRFFTSSLIVALLLGSLAASVEAQNQKRSSRVLLGRTPATARSTGPITSTGRTLQGGNQIVFQQAQPKSETQIKVPGAKNRYQLRLLIERAQSSYSQGPREIWTMMPDGSGLTQVFLAQNYNTYRDPAASPSGTFIAFARKQGRDGEFQICTANMNGPHFKVLSTVRVLTSGGPHRHPSWSPDGKQIAYTSPGRGIYIMNADGTNVRRLPVNYDAYAPTWTPDGAFIIYKVNHRIYNNRALVYMNSIRGNSRTRQLASDANQGSRVAVSPDGTRIVYTHEWGYLVARTITNAGPGTANQLTIHGPRQANCEDTNPCFTPDGTKIVFQRYQPDRKWVKEHSAIIVMDAVQGVRTFSKVLTKVGPDGYDSWEFNSNPNWVKLPIGQVIKR